MVIRMSVMFRAMLILLAAILATPGTPGAAGIDQALSAIAEADATASHAHGAVVGEQPCVLHACGSAAIGPAAYVELRPHAPLSIIRWRIKADAALRRTPRADDPPPPRTA